MVKVETNTDGIVWASVLDVVTFKEADGKELKSKLRQEIKDHDSITLNLFGVQRFSENGYKLFSNFVHKAYKQNCTLVFSEVHDDLIEIVESFVKNNES